MPRLLTVISQAAGKTLSSPVQGRPDPPCRPVPDDAVLSVGFLWGRRLRTRTCGEALLPLSVICVRALQGPGGLARTGTDAVGVPVTACRAATITVANFAS